MTLQTINSFLAQYGLLCIFVIVLLEYMNLPGFPAGLMRMDIKEYLIYSTLGILVWNGGFIAAGYFLGEKAFQLLG